MDVLMLLLNLAVFAALIYGLVAGSKKLNERSRNTYDGFAPVNGWTVVISTISILGIVIGVIYLAEHGEFPTWPWPEEFLHSPTFNMLVVLALGLLLVIGQFVVLWIKTSFLTALAASLILLVLGLFMSTLVFLIIFLLLLAHDRRQSRRIPRW